MNEFEADKCDVGVSSRCGGGSYEGGGALDDVGGARGDVQDS